MGKCCNIYLKDAAQEYYELNRKNSHRPINIPPEVIQYISKNLKNKKYSPEIITRNLKINGYSISTSLIYYHEKYNKKLFDFQLKDQIHKRRYHNRADKKKTERLYGKGFERNVLPVLTARKTRYELIMKIKDKTTRSVEEAIDLVEMGLGKRFSSVFKTITVDNGTAFANTSGIENSLNGGIRTVVFYCHPYCSCERGSNENNNRFIRRIIPKGKAISNFTEKDIFEIQKYINTYPRKMFNFETSESLFIKECGFSF